MEVSLRIPPDDFSTDSLEAAASRLVELVPDHERLRLTVTTDLVEAVREAIVDDPAYAAAYQQDRPLAFAIAKTITQADGSTDLIVDAGVFSLEADPTDALRTFEHEALHIAVTDRGEAMSDLRSRRGQTRETAAGTYSSITGVACEEYRVERAMWGLHPDASERSHLAEFHILLTRFEEQVRPASVQYQRDLDVEAICRSVMEAFHALCTSTAYVAAEMDAAPDRDIAVDPDLDDRLLGDPWRAAVAALRCLPAADTPTDFDELEHLSLKVTEGFEEWLEHIGFSFIDRDDGCLHFGVLNPEDWVTWKDLL